MTLPFSRRSRERKAAIAGDFPDTGETITDILKRVGLDDTEVLSHVHHDDTIAFAGASAGTMPAEPDTRPLAWLRAQPAAPAAPRRQDTGPMPKLSRYAARPRPQRIADAAIFIWSPILGQHIMKCGICLRSRYADPIAATMPFEFDALRVSAWNANWRLDLFSRWGCPACQMTPDWHARHGVTLWAEGAGWARLHHDPDAEWGAVAIAEQHLIRDVAAAAKQGRHRVVMSFTDPMAPWVTQPPPGEPVPPHMVILAALAYTALDLREPRDCDDCGLLLCDDHRADAGLAAACEAVYAQVAWGSSELADLTVTLKAGMN